MVTVFVGTIVVIAGQRHDLEAMAWVIGGLVVANGLALAAVSLLSNLHEGELSVRGPAGVVMHWGHPCSSGFEGSSEPADSPEPHR